MTNWSEVEPELRPDPKWAWGEGLEFATLEEMLKSAVIEPGTSLITATVKEIPKALYMWHPERAKWYYVADDAAFFRKGYSPTMAKALLDMRVANLDLKKSMEGLKEKS